MRMKLIRTFTAAMVLGVVLSFAGAVAAQTRNDLKRAKEFADAGDKAFRQKEYRQAAELYGQAIVIVPTNPYCHFWKGYAHYYLQEYDLSERSFVLALNQGFKPIEVYKVRWYLFYVQKKYSEAVGDLKKAVELEPKNTNLLKGLGDSHLALGANQDALNAYQRALLITPKDADLYYSIAYLHAQTGNLKGQEQSAGEAIRMGTQYMGEAHYLLADALERQKNFAAAITSYQRAISAKPTLYQAYRNLANIYQRQNKLSNAIETLKKAILLFPNDGNIYTDISWFYSLNDRPADAVQAALAAIKFLPDQYMGYTNLCRAYNETKQYKEAVSACNSALKLKPGDGETFFYLGRASDLLGKPSEATGYYRKAVTGLVEFTNGNPDYADGFYLLGNAYFADNQRDRAIEAYTKCLQLSPNFAKARYNLGIILVLKKDKTGAMTQYSFLLAQDVALAGKLKAEIDKL
ncbi:MAG: tetratricopeptide repeat protein [Acidobacteria bacterium]|nr:tetratricopeptide repeat protein [Acidobacteriota bacterium]